MSNEFFNAEWNKKSVDQPNYPEITPEQQAQVNQARDNEKLTRGLSGGGNQSRGKGISVETTQSGRVDTGNGITRITNPDGSVEFEIDYNKYDGRPLLFAEGTKVTYINQPEVPFLTRVANWWNRNVTEPLNEWGREASGGYIQKFGRGVNTLGAVAGGAAVASSVATAATVGAGAMVLTGCEKDDYIPEPPVKPDEKPDNVPDEEPDADNDADAGVWVKITNQEVAQDVVDHLNDPNFKNQDKTSPNYGKGYTTKTNDDVQFRYNFDYEAEQDVVRPYVTLGEGDNQVKMYITPRSDIEVGDVIKYITTIGDEKTTANDGVEYKFGLDGDEPNIQIGPNGEIKLPINSKDALNAEQIIPYINLVGGEHKTAGDEIGYNFALDGNKPIITIGKDGKSINLELKTDKDITPKNVIDYINMIGGEHTTIGDEIGYNFGLNGEKPAITIGKDGKTINVEIKTDKPLTPQNVVDYINLIGGDFKTVGDEIDYNFGMQGKDAAITISKDGKSIDVGIKTGQPLTPQNVVDYINLIGGDFKTVGDNVEYAYGVTNGNPGITIGKNGDTVKIPIAGQPITNENVVDYISIVGGTEVDGYKAEYGMMKGNAQIAFKDENGDTKFTYTLTDPRETTPNANSPMGILQAKMEAQGGWKLDQGGIVTAITSGPAAYDEKSGFNIMLQNGGSLNDLFSANGTPQIKGNLREHTFEGTLHKANVSGTKLENDFVEFKDEQALVVKDANGNIQATIGKGTVNAGTAEYQYPVDGLIISVGDATYVMADVFGTGKIDMAEIDGVNEAVFTYYDRSSESFNGLQPAIDYFDEKKQNIVDTRDKAKTHYDDKNQNLINTRDEAEKHYDEKNKNLDDTRDAAEKHYDEKNKNLDDTRDAAEKHYDEKDKNLTDTRDEAKKYYDDKDKNLKDAQKLAEANFLDVYKVSVDANAYVEIDY